MRIHRERLLQRFLRYVQVDTSANDRSDTYPSSPGQLELGRLVKADLEEIGLADVSHDEFGIVIATVPATADRRCPTIALAAHLDTSPETTGRNVKPQVIGSYQGGDIVLPGDPLQIIREDPQLRACIGHSIITTDGTTLLGSDDKAGVAVIVETAAYLQEHREVLHGPLRLCFTCDEEIGHGVDHIDLAKLGATVCYTLDGQDAGEIDVETFSADLATVTIRGVNIHPGIAKGRMVNAVRIAGQLLARLPSDRLAPEATEDRQGFLHPYQIHGGVGEVVLRIILRDFETAQLAVQAELLKSAVAELQSIYPRSHIEVSVTPQYRNMAEGLSREPRAVAFAEAAFARLGRACQRTIVRGGTDGSRLTELGLPTPNLSTGQHNIHSPLEWASLDQMVGAAEVLAVLASIWYEQG